jgi:hypothetical protein
LVGARAELYFRHFSICDQIAACADCGFWLRFATSDSSDEGLRDLGSDLGTEGL